MRGSRARTRATIAVRGASAGAACGAQGECVKKIPELKRGVVFAPKHPLKVLCRNLEWCCMPHGRSLIFDKSALESLNLDEAVLLWYGISTDIEGRKRAEEEREKLRADLAHVNRVSMLGELAASVSHSSPSPPPSPAPTAALHGSHTNRPIWIGPVRQQAESISTGIVRLKSSTVYVLSTRSLLHNVSWSR
jgi:hypothetical protein